MRILYLSQYFPPEIGATQTRAFEMARGLVKAGHSVTIITEFPNHPVGVIPAAYRGKVIVREELEGIDVVRVWVKASTVKQFRQRLAFYVSYMIMAIVAGILFARGKFDAVYATSPPLFVGGAGLVLSILRRTPLVFEVRDLWPESAVQLGQLNRTWAVRLSTWLEEACYKKAHKIVVVTNGIRRSLLARGYDDDKLVLIPNGANTDIYYKRPADPQLRESLGIDPDEFVVIFTGLFGLVHGMDIIIDAAGLLTGEPIRFLLVGDGPMKDELVQQATARSLDNIIIHPAVPEQELPGLLALAHVGLHTQRNLAISRMALPVKMFSYMACELPVLLAINGEAATLVNEHEIGLVVEPEDPQALASAIYNLRTNPQKCREYGQRGRMLVEKQYSRQGQAQELTRLLKGVLRSKIE